MKILVKASKATTKGSCMDYGCKGYKPFCPTPTGNKGEFNRSTPKTK